MAAADKLVACICRGVLLAAYAGIVQGHRVTGFTRDSQLSVDQYRELAVEPVVVQSGGIWENCQVVIDRNIISSRHPRDLKFFTEALCKHLWQDTKVSPFDTAFSPD